MGEVDSFTTQEIFLGFFNLNGTVIFNRPIWFLMTLFFSMLLFFYVSRLPVAGQFIVAVAAALMAFTLPSEQFRLPFGIDVALLALLFIVIGHQSRPLLIRLEESKNPVKLLMLIFSVAVTFIFSQIHGRNAMGSMGIDNWVYFYIA